QLIAVQRGDLLRAVEPHDVKVRPRAVRPRGVLPCENEVRDGHGCRHHSNTSHRAPRRTNRCWERPCTWSWLCAWTTHSLRSASPSGDALPVTHTALRVGTPTTTSPGTCPAICGQTSSSSKTHASRSPPVCTTTSGGRWVTCKCTPRRRFSTATSCSRACVT